MPAARYWKLAGVETFGGQALELSEVQLYAFGARVDAAITMTCSHAPVSGSLANLQDANTASICRFSAEAVRSPGFAMFWDFGGTSPDVSQFRLGSSALKAEYVALADLYYSSNGYDWTLAAMAAGMLSWPGANTMAPVDPLGDLDFDKVSYLAHCDGAHNSTTIVDSSGSPLSTTCYGNAKLSNVQSKWGGTSLALLGAGDYAAIANGVGTDFGGEAFTAEVWVYPTSLASFAHVMGKWGLTGGCSWHLGIGAGATVVAEVTASGSYDPSYSGWGAAAITVDTWNHLALVLIPSVSTKVYANGVAAFTMGAPAGTANLPDLLTIGRNPNGQQFTGYIDDVRITKGLARYTADFTPPGAAFPGAPGVRDPRTIHTRQTGISQPYAGYSTPGSVQAMSTARQSVFRDLEFGGPGRVWGTTKVKGTPNLPTKARVVLLHQRSKVVARETWSDATTGVFAFDGIDIRQEFITLAEDAAGLFRPVAANKLVPEVVA